ncbi:MAG TPA: ABC transporter ATP-binding protein [Acidiphilium sp.]
MTGSGVAIENVSLRLGTFLLKNVTLGVAEGEILVVLGPNGAGKSVTLETIAGFHRPASGRVIIAGRDVTGLPPEKRRIGLLFQNFGLFPHLSVAVNVALGLRMEKSSKPANGSRASTLAALLARFAIAPLADRLPSDLSPGEKQRTALARAFAMQPDLFMFDEPFSALDVQNREALREELRVFLRETRIPAIFVTHDQDDAAVLADRVAVMDRGAVVQDGPAAELFQAPASAFVADFVGIDNRLPGRVLGRIGDLWRIAIGDRLLHARDARFTGGDNANVVLCVRGEDVVLHGGDACTGANDPAANRIAMRVVRITGLGALRKIVLEGGFSLTACLTRREAGHLSLAPGDSAIVEIDPGAIHLLAATPESA